VAGCQRQCAARAYCGVGRQGQTRDCDNGKPKGGYGHVAAYLASFDLSEFDAKAPPPKTAAFWAIVNANRSPEDAELADTLDLLGNPVAITLAKIQAAATAEFAEWLRERRNRKMIQHRLESCGYTAVRNEAASDGMWRADGKRQVIYAHARLPERDRLAAAKTLVG
jgi:hypothetical protein